MNIAEFPITALVWALSHFEFVRGPHPGTSAVVPMLVGIVVAWALLGVIVGVMLDWRLSANDRSDSSK